MRSIFTCLLLCHQGFIFLLVLVVEVLRLQSHLIFWNQFSPSSRKMVTKIFTFTVLGCLLSLEGIVWICFLLVVNCVGATLKENVEEILGLLVILSPKLDSFGIGAGKPCSCQEQLKICH
jgi:hypothetical protein